MLTGTNETVLFSSAERGVDDHVEEAELRREELAGARAAALEEELDGEAVADEPANVGVDDGGVEAIALEAPADEEGAGAPEDGPDREEREVVARRDRRDLEGVLAEHVREEHVVDVALVARQQHERALPRRVAHALEALFVDVDAGVELLDERVGGELEALQASARRAASRARAASDAPSRSRSARVSSSGPARSRRIAWSLGLRSTSSRTRSAGFCAGPTMARRSRSTRRRSA